LGALAQERTALVPSRISGRQPGDGGCNRLDRNARWGADRNDPQSRLRVHQVPAAAVGLYQNHAGAKYVGATVWDLQSLIDEIPVAEIGFAFDIRHAVAEAGLAWPVSENVAAAHVGERCLHIVQG